MVSYVLLITITIGISIGVFVWLKYIATDPKPEINCEIGTSVIIESYECENGILRLSIKNNGLFNVRGVNVKVSNDSDREPITELAPGGSSLQGTVPGHFLFSNPLKPNDNASVIFGKTIILGTFHVPGSGDVGGNDAGDNIPDDEDILTGGYSIKVISVQPFVTDGDKLIYCSDAVIKENLVNCEI